VRVNSTRAASLSLLTIPYAPQTLEFCDDRLIVAAFHRLCLLKS